MSALVPLRRDFAYSPHRASREENIRPDDDAVFVAVPAQSRRPHELGQIPRPAGKETPAHSRPDCGGQCDRSHNTVSTESVSDNGHGTGLNPSSAWPGTSALIVRTRLTVLTQNSRSSSGQEIAAATSKFDHSSY